MPESTAHYYFMLWEWDGTLEPIHQTLYIAAREGWSRGLTECGDYREPDCQGVSKRGSRLDLQGFDAGKKVRGSRTSYPR